MLNTNQEESQNSNIGIAPVGTTKARVGVERRVDHGLGTVILTETRALEKGFDDKKTRPELFAEVSTSAAEVLSSHLSSYLNSADQKDKVTADDPAFAAFIRQSIDGTDPIIVDTAIHANTMEGGGQPQSFDLLEKAEKEGAEFDAMGLNDVLPAVTCNLEVVVAHPMGVHSAHRGQSRQFLITDRGPQKITKEHNTGGLLSSLDGMGDFLPQVEVRSIRLKPRERIVVFSQGCFPQGHKINLEKLIGERTASPQRHAMAIARRVGEYKVEGGYVVVLDRMKKPDSPFSDRVLGQLSPASELSNPKTEKVEQVKTVSKSVVGAPAAAILKPVPVSTPVPVPSSSRPKPPPLKREKKDSSIAKNIKPEPKDGLEESHYFSARELADFRRRMKNRFEDEIGSFGDDVYEILEEEMAAMGERLAEKRADFAISENYVVKQPTENPEQDFDERSTSPMALSKDSSSIASFLEDSSEFVELVSVNKIVKPNDERTKIGNAVTKNESRYLFARRWMLPIVVVLLVLSVTTAVILVSNDEKYVEKPTPAPQEQARVIPARLDVKTVVEQEAISGAEPDGKADDTSDEMETEDGFIIGVPQSRKQAHAAGRRLYNAGDSGRDSSGGRIKREARISNLLGALSYLKFAGDIDDARKKNNTDLLFLKARTHYLLAKFEHSRGENAKSAIEGFQMLKQKAGRLSEKKKKTIARNMSKLRSWLR